jgi:putative ABC transport system ATP-binding protein
MTLEKPTLTATGVRLARGGEPFAELPNLEAYGGQSVAIIGASGSGKTTALMALAGVRPPEGGAIEIEGVDLWRLNASQRDQLRGRRIGLVFQSFHLVDALSVAENLTLVARCAGLADDAGRVDDLLDRLDIPDIGFQRADRISHGQAQRVAVARALFNRPAVVLADEPTSALDDANAALLLSLLKETAAIENAALVLATHDRRVLDTVDTVIEMVPIR